MVVRWAGAVLNTGIEWACASPALNATLRALLGCNVSKKDVHELFPLQVNLSFKLFPFEGLLPSYSDVVLGKDQSLA